MLFSGIPFLYCFLPAALAVYFAAPQRLKNAALFLLSVLFYGWGEPKYVLLMLGVICVTFFFGIAAEKLRNKKGGRAFFLVCVLFYVCVLGYFKYADFFISVFSKTTGLSIPLLNVALPVGISFYIFQTLSYVIDVYRGDVRANRSFISLAAYVSMFPQLIAGPIVRYSDIKGELAEKKTFDAVRVQRGAVRFIIGLSKKVILANTLGEVAAAYISSSHTVVFTLIYAVSYSMQIYFDFSGYSDMAIGLGEILGFHFPENFNYPFISKSVTEFWRRWHMTLGSWFRDYVYIPLGGNRANAARQVLNILIVWALTGLWHGASLNFVIWGLYFAVILAAEKFVKRKTNFRPPAFLRHIYVIFAVFVSFMIFSFTDFEQLKNALELWKMPFFSKETLYYLKNYAGVIIISGVLCTPLVKKLILKLKAQNKYVALLYTLEIIACVFLLILCTAFIVDGSYNPFLYFRF